MEVRDKKFYNKVREQEFEEKQLWWFSCRLGHSDEGTFLFKDYSFENAVEQLTEATEKLGYDGSDIFDWDFNVDRKVDYDYSEEDFLAFYR